MKPIISPAEAARLDRESVVSIDELMERAGRAVALVAAQMGMGYGSRVAVLAGPGNNGGDAYVAARHLRRRGVGVKVYRLAPPKTEAAGRAESAARAEGVEVAGLSAPVSADLIVDGMFGGGFRAGLPSEVGAWIEARMRTLSIDIPSGVDPALGTVRGAAFVAEKTVTFEYLKTGHLLEDGPDYCGDVVVAPIGLGKANPELLLAEAEDAQRPARPRRAHKWSAGSVLVVGGARGMTGAAILAGRAALRFGAGAVGLAAPEDGATVATAAAPELLHHPIDSLPDRYHTLVIGPGLGADHNDLARKVIESWPGPVVVDADALGLVTGRHHGQMVMTPHTGEFERTSGQPSSPAAAAEHARRMGAVVVLKGNPTFVTDGSQTWVVNTGGPELATIGTGDVLAGMIGALLAAGLDPLTAARSACYWHGRAGALLARRSSVTASALIDQIDRLP